MLTNFCAKLIRNKVGTMSPQKRAFHTNKNLKRFHSKLANKILNIYWLRAHYGHMNLKSVLNNNCTASRTVLTRKFQKTYLAKLFRCLFALPYSKSTTNSTRLQYDT